MSGSFGPSVNLASPPAIGNITPNTVSATNTSSSGTLVRVPGSTQTLTASTSILCTTNTIPISASSVITLTSNPQINTGLNGQKVNLVNIGTNSIILVVGNGLLMPSNIILLGGRSASFTYFTVYSAWLPDVVIPSATTTVSGLMVQAQQNSGVTLTSGVYTVVPFPVEMFDGSNLFTGGIFTPSTTGSYRVSCNLFLSVSSGAIGLYAVGVFQSGTSIGTIFLDNATGVSVTQSGYVIVTLTAGTSYDFRAFCGGTSPTITIGSAIQNTLTIERLI